VNARAIFEQKSPTLLSKYSCSFVDDVLKHTSQSQTNYNIQKQGESSSYFFQGYPSGNFLKQVCVIMSIWKQTNKFPITYKQVPGLSGLDETDSYVGSLDTLTPLIDEIFKQLSAMSSNGKSPRAL
jgi:hypothetical protein